MITEIARAPAPAPTPPPAPQALRAVAGELAAMARRIPHWDPSGDEDWIVFQRRRLAAERALATRLARMPGCEVVLSEDGWEVGLTLSGISTKSGDRLQGACLEWARRAGG